MSEKFQRIKGVALISDPTGVAPGYLTGGQNLLKRNKVGVVRRPGYGALNVQEGEVGEDEAISVGGTDPRACFPFLYYGDSPSIVGLANGVLSKYDGVDSFDQITKGLTDAVPTYCSLGELGVVASGGRVLKYDGEAVPSPVGSLPIDDFEDDSDWTGDDDDETSSYVSGNQSKLLHFTGATTEAMSLPLVNSRYFWAGVGLTSDEIGDVADTEFNRAVGFVPSESHDVDKVVININYSAGSPSGTLTVKLSEADEDGEPTGAVLATATTTTLSSGVQTLALSGTVSIVAGTRYFLIYDLEDQDTGDHITMINNVLLAQTDAGIDSSQNERWTQEDSGSWVRDATGSSIGYIFRLIETGVFDMTDGGAYGEDSLVCISVRSDDNTEITEGAASYIRFTDEDDEYAEYRFSQSDFPTAWTELQLTRGPSGTGGVPPASGDFTDGSGDIDWTNIKQIDISIQAGGAVDVWFDYLYLLSDLAPEASDKVSRADNRVWIVSGNRFYYSDQYTPNNYSADGYIDFADNGVGAVDAGERVLCLTESGCHVCTPLDAVPTLEASPDSDYIVRKLDLYGCIGKHAFAEIKYKGQRGAAFVTKNGGIYFYNGQNEPVQISQGIHDIFTNSRADTLDFDYTRGDECFLLYHPRWHEMWMFYPSLTSGEENLTYAFVLDCDSGEWMPVFKWANTEKIVFASIVRDPVDGLYKILLTDTDGKVWVEGFSDGTALTSATSRDGYVSGDDKGGVIVPYADTWWFHGEGKEVVFHEIVVKLKPNTTSAMELNIDYAVTAKDGTISDDDTYPGEENIIYNEDFADLLQRSFTMSDEDDVVTRNANVEDEIRGQAIKLRVGMQDIEDEDTDYPEFEIIGISVKGGEEGGI